MFDKCFWSHDWDKWVDCKFNWEVTSPSPLPELKSPERRIVQRDGQYRYCKRCGIRQDRTV